MDWVNAAMVRQWADACVRTLNEHRLAIDSINVFPVADRDTGTNLLRTMQAAADAVSRRAEAADAETWAALASGALAGARGNSGVILSQVLRGFAEVLGDRQADPRVALQRADELAAKAVSDPAPGTMLTVLRAAALAVVSTQGGLAEVITVAARVANEALANTREQLAVLARAGVVDAGAQGLVLVLLELAAIVTGSHPPAPTARPRAPREADTLLITREAGSTEYAYEVMYALDDVSERVANELSGNLRGVGDCVSVVGDGQGRWTVHVHCNDIGAAIEAGIAVARPRRITVVRFDDQEPAVSNRFARKRAVVALSSGVGIGALFRAEGATVLAAARDLPPGVAELVAVIAGTQASQVTVLPNELEFAAIVDEAAGQATAGGQEVLVVPTLSPVQGLAALAVHDASRRANVDVVAMAEAAAATRRGELVVAEEEAITWAGRCQPGDVLGLLDGEVVLIEAGPATDRTLLAGATHLVRCMLAAGGELITALSGEHAPSDLIDELGEYVRTAHREMEFVGYAGGQSTAVLLLGVE